MMSDSPNIKSQGLTFAEQHMQKHGWTEGKGLGKKENGISQAIKVKVKCDTAGVGHNSAEQFTFHWWDHVFNKTASSISVESDHDGVQVKKLTEDECTVTNKKPRKALTNRDMLYGRFIKSATLLSGGEKPVEEPSSSESSSSEDEDAKLDLSSATKLTDDDLMKVCGGRTAHKGARHGLTMSAKLSRLKEQEREFLERYGKKEQKSQKLKAEHPSAPEDLEATKKKKKKRREILDSAGTEDSSQEASKSKKRKKHKKDHNEVEEAAENGCEEDEQPEEENQCSRKKKHKRDKNRIEEIVENGREEDQPSNQEPERITKKKKKSKSDHKEPSLAREEQMEPPAEGTDESVKSRKTKKRRE